MSEVLQDAQSFHMDDIEQPRTPSIAGISDPPARWGAVAAMTLSVFGIVASEFLPVGALTPMAASLGITAGQAGQTVTASAILAAVASLLTPVLTRGVDRRWVLLAFSVLVVASNLAVALATNLTLLLLGRILLGISVGGFWTVGMAALIRLVPAPRLPRALTIMMSGVSAATIVAVPLGAYATDTFDDWRLGFFIMAALGTVACVIQFITLPPLQPQGQARFGTLVAILVRPRIGALMFAFALIFVGHFTFFTYIRPFLERSAGMDGEAIFYVLLGSGIANFAGTSVAGFLVERNLRLTLIAIPMLIAGMALALAQFGHLQAVDMVLILMWGAAFGIMPVAVPTWISRAVPDAAETANGLFVAIVQTAVGVGAVVGGLIVDSAGVTGVLITGSVALIGSSLLLLARLRG